MPKSRSPVVEIEIFASTPVSSGLTSVGHRLGMLANQGKLRLALSTVGVGFGSACYSINCKGAALAALVLGWFMLAPFKFTENPPWVFLMFLCGVPIVFSVPFSEVMLTKRTKVSKGWLHSLGVLF